MTYRVGEEVEVKREAAPPSTWDQKAKFVAGRVVRLVEEGGQETYYLDFDGYGWYVYAENMRRLARTPFEERVYAYIERELSS